MAGNDDADRIGAVGVADRTRRLRHIEMRRQRTVAHGRARWNRRQRRPHLALERRARNAPSDRFKPMELALEISRQRDSNLARGTGVGEHHRTIMQPQQLLHAPCVILPLERAQQTIRVRHEQRRADRGFQAVEREDCARRCGCRVNCVRWHRRWSPEQHGIFLLSPCASRHPKAGTRRRKFAFPSRIILHRGIASSSIAPRWRDTDKNPNTQNHKRNATT